MITLVGGIPGPVGGVTNYLYRLAVHFNEYIDQIIDLYPSEKKWSINNVPCLVRPNSRLKTVLFLFNNLSTSQSQIIYFNFSTPGSLFLLGAFPKRRGCKWYLTLHHGELERVLAQKGTLGRLLFRKVLSRFDRIGFINTKQKDFYLRHGASKDCLHKIITYLPYVTCSSENTELAQSFKNKLSQIRSSYSKAVVASGYPTSLYRHDWVLDMLESDRLDDSTSLILCLYGDDSEGKLDYLRKRAAMLSNVHLLESLSPGQFQAVLSNSDIYVRPTETDSYGVAVAEALHLGLVVIASDACDRTPGAHLFSCHDRARFEQLFQDAVRDQLPIIKNKPIDSLGTVAKFLGIDPRISPLGNSSKTSFVP